MLVPDKYKNHIQLSNSRRDSFSKCARKYYWSYEQELTTPYGATALRYGKVWHSVLEAYYSHVIEYGWDKKDALGSGAIEYALRLIDDVWEEETGDLEFKEDWRTKEALAESFINYITKYNTDRHTLEIIATEHKFMVEVELTEDEKKLFPYIANKAILFTGIIDMIAKEHGHIWAYEHKTTGSWLAQIVNTLRRSAQTQGYLKNVQEEYKDKFFVEGIMINLHHLSAGKLKTGGYGKKKIEFERNPQMYSEADFREWRLSSLAVLNDLQRAKDTNFWPMNLDHCHDYNKPCPFTPLCEQNKVDLRETVLEGFIKRKRDI